MVSLWIWIGFSELDFWFFVDLDRFFLDLDLNVGFSLDLELVFSVDLDRFFNWIWTGFSSDLELVFYRIGFGFSSDLVSVFLSIWMMYLR